jgi:HAD superfamily hydrolase (TIGR01509 family)
VPAHPQATVDLISDLKTFRLAVVSSSDLAEIEPPLVASGIRSKLDALVTASDVKEPKPSPEPYLRAAHLLNAKCPLVVEDSPAGIASGKPQDLTS